MYMIENTADVSLYANVGVKHAPIIFLHLLLSSSNSFKRYLWLLYITTKFLHINAIIFWDMIYIQCIY